MRASSLVDEFDCLVAFCDLNLFWYIYDPAVWLNDFFPKYLLLRFNGDYSASLMNDVPIRSTEFWSIDTRCGYGLKTEPTDCSSPILGRLWSSVCIAVLWLIIVFERIAWSIWVLAVLLPKLFGYCSGDGFASITSFYCMTKGLRSYLSLFGALLCLYFCLSFWDFSSLSMRLICRWCWKYPSSCW